MVPIRTKRSNFIYRSPSPDIPDMPGERIEPGRIRSVWELTGWERDAVSQGGNIELNIFAEPIPPVSLNITGDRSTWVTTAIFAERVMGDDGRWYVHVVSREGVRITQSKGYMHQLGAWLAQRRLKSILPALEIWPSATK